ncbi:hypothetical protein [Amantichitinum ursilacus]|uniref:Uncharacterized protein n=1 Tax=Amantichitinum ursilacus TaxID=857265 RepID=A0A0N0XKR6_9NEIS|nr:hypothetical protein [Amantichitinum ursilacus]KPC53061.1 hypothetical protein WG78_11240 [Amantichitinum ursilacus]
MPALSIPVPPSQRYRKPIPLPPGETGLHMPERDGELLEPTISDMPVYPGMPDAPRTLQ